MVLLLNIVPSVAEGLRRKNDGRSYGFKSISPGYKVKFFATLWQYGPKWSLDVQIQAKLRGLGLDSNSEIYKGSKAIYNHAEHPETAPSTDSLEELEYINSQQTTNYKKSTLEGLASLVDLLRNDVTENFINQFKKLFSKFVNDDKIVLVYEEL